MLCLFKPHSWTSYQVLPLSIMPLLGWSRKAFHCNKTQNLCQLGLKILVLPSMVSRNLLDRREGSSALSALGGETHTVPLTKLDPQRGQSRNSKYPAARPLSAPASFRANLPLVPHRSPCFSPAAQSRRAAQFLCPVAFAMERGVNPAMSARRDVEWAEPRTRLPGK